MWPLFGFFDAMVLGLIAGLLEAIPVFSARFSAWCRRSPLAHGRGRSGAAVGRRRIYLGVSFPENNLILAPLIMAGAMKLHPVAVMISMLLLRDDPLACSA